MLQCVAMCCCVADSIAVCKLILIETYRFAKRTVLRFVRAFEVLNKEGGGGL